MKEGISMKKLLVTFLSIVLLLTLFATVAFAEAGNDKPNNGKSTEQKQEKKDEQDAKKDAIKERIEERKEAREVLKADFQARTIEHKELREATKTQLQEQRQLVLQYKEQLQSCIADIEGLTPEERAEYADELLTLRQEVRNAHKQQLEIREAYKAEIKEIFPGVRVGQAPSSEEVEDVVVDVLGDL